MPDVVVDTNILADLLAQFYETERRTEVKFVARASITRELALILNKIARWHSQWLPDEACDGRYPGRVVASVFAFVEIARKWDQIIGSRISVEEMAAFLEQPPDWFTVEPVDENLVLACCEVPAAVKLRTSAWHDIEWTDAVHLATAVGRGPGTRLATTDRLMKQAANSIL